MRRHRAAGLLAASAAVVVVGTATSSTPRTPRQAAISPATEDVRWLSPSAIQARAVSPNDRGATYYAIENAATRVTARFGDAVAIADRGTDGILRTRLVDEAQNELATFRARGAGSADRVLEYQAAGRAPLLLERSEQIQPTLDWTARQAYRLWKDATDPAAARLVWRNGLMRPSGAPDRALDDDTLEVRTEWPDGLTSIVSSSGGRRPNIVTGQTIAGHTIVGRLARSGVSLGTVEWYPEERMAVWSLPGITEGSLDAKRLERIGGWPFTPDMAWAGVQAFAFLRFHEQITARRFVASAPDARGGPLRRALSFFAPALSANETGCDGLHWLDGTVLRYCCDVHDYCYSRNGCTATSWWVWWSSWTCDYCNMTVVYCFSTGGSYYPFRRAPG